VTHSSINQNIVLIFSELSCEHSSDEDSNANPNVDPHRGDDLDDDNEDDNEEPEPNSRVLAYVELARSVREFAPH
jgi:hypothetical protein